MQVAPEKKTKWQAKREASYLALVESAMRQFHARGYALTRVEDVVAGTGYTSGAFYFHFKNKTECFWHVIEHRQRLRGDWSRVTEGLDPSTASLADVLGRVFAHFRAVDGGFGNWFLVMVDFHQQHRDDADAVERLRVIYDSWHADVARFVGALQQGGWISPARDADTIAAQLFAATEGFQAHATLYSFDAGTALADLLVRILEGPA